MPNTDQSACPWLQSDDIIPAFTLPGADGMPHSPRDYKQRENLVLLFTRSTTTSEGRGMLHTFAKHYTDFREEVCAVLVITADTVIVNLEAQEALHLPFPLLSDPTGKVISRYTRWDDTRKSLAPSIALANRYNAFYQQWIAENEAELPPITELLESLQYLNRLCTP
jgi:peroxiredoxin